MVDIAPLRINVQQEEVAYRSSVSEATMSRIGSSVNFINYRQHSEKQFFLNGPYGILSMPQIGVDGIAVFEFDAEIINVWAFNLIAGTSGDTELDIKASAAVGSGFASIFLTKPIINYQAGNNYWIGKDVFAPNATGAVLSTTTFTAGTAIRLDLTQSQVGGQNCGIIIHYRPISL